MTPASAVLSVARARAAHGEPFPMSCRGVADLTNLSPTAVRLALRALVAEGVLEQVSRGSGPGSWMPSEYVLNGSAER